MTDKELLQQALDALYEYDYSKTDKADAMGFRAIKALEAAIALPATLEPLTNEQMDSINQGQWALQAAIAQPEQQALNHAGIKALNCALEGFAQPEQPTLIITDAQIKAAFPFAQGWNHSPDDLHRYRCALKIFAAIAQPAQIDGDAKDAELLDFLDSMNGFKWLARQSVTNRGFRVHQAPDGIYDTARQAIRAAIASQKGAI